MDNFKKNLLYRPLPTPGEMRRWDAAASERFGIPTLLLMENAAQAACSVLRERCPLRPHSRVLVFMGKGNNGGDGAGLARRLHDEGHEVLVPALAPPHALGGAAGEHARMAEALGVRFRVLSPDGTVELPEDWTRPEVVIDALTGTGITGALRERELACVRRMNALRDRAFILSLDLPSGLCALRGSPLPEAVRAHATVSFEAGKPGLYLPEAAAFTGHIEVRRVGIPLAVRETLPPSWRLLAPEKGAFPRPSPLQHKGGAGKTLVIGGSESMSGAPLLAALGSLRAGAGLAHAALPAGLAASLRAAFPEILLHPVGQGAFWRAEDAPELLSLIGEISPDALVLGPGMGRSPCVGALVRALLEIRERPPLIADADALFFFRPQGFCELLTQQDILTPHPGELARMLPEHFFAGGASRTACVQENRPEALRTITEDCRATLVLKGAGTLIGRRGEPVTLSPFAVSTLGVGGSGDVLAGVIAALVASGLPSLDAASLGVYLHGRAGELLAARSPRGHLARDIADAVPEVWKELCEV